MAWKLTPIFLPGESHGQRSLVGYSPRGHKELDTTEQLSTHLVQELCAHTHSRRENIRTHPCLLPRWVTVIWLNYFISIWLLVPCLVAKEKRLRNDKFSETHKNNPLKRWEILQGKLSESHRKWLRTMQRETCYYTKQIHIQILHSKRESTPFSFIMRLIKSWQEQSSLFKGFEYFIEEIQFQEVTDRLKKT